MVTWFKTYRERIPIADLRQAPYIIDFDCEEELDPAIFLAPMKHAIAAVDDIVKNYPPPYNVFVSGGVDSQAMLWAWVNSGHKFTACHFQYDHQYNVVELEDLEKFITHAHLKNVIDLKVMSFDALGFIIGPEIAEYVRRYDTISPQITTHFKLIEKVTGTAIFAGNFIDPSKNSSLTYTILGLKRYAEVNYLKLVPFFFLHTPQLAYSFFNSYVNSNEEDYYLRRIKIYQKHGFPVIPQTAKTTGFEKIKEVFDDVRLSYKERLKWASQKSKRPFDILYRYNHYDITGYYSDNVKIKHHRMINNIITKGYST